jgi:hypothetical protein
VIDVLGFLLLLIFLASLIGFALFGNRWPVFFRPLPGYEELGNALERAVESGDRIHLSLGTGPLSGFESAPALAGLAILAQIASSSMMSDKPLIVSTGDGATATLAQDTLYSAYRKAGAESNYHSTYVRMLGPTPFSYIAGIPSLLSDEEVAVHILTGSFGIEGALAADFGRREGIFVLAGAEDVQAQALLYATADYPMIGEEIFAGGAYLDAGEYHKASLRTQDVVRLVIIATILLGVLLRTVGIIP